MKDKIMLSSTLSVKYFYYQTLSAKAKTSLIVTSNLLRKTFQMEVNIYNRVQNQNILFRFNWFGLGIDLKVMYERNFVK